jgi:dCMP deaminase
VADLSSAAWDRRWLDLATLIGSWSKDRSRGVGCVFVGSANQILSTGYNGLPRGIDDDIDERHERPEKYDWTEHAERNAIFNAARTGTALEGSVAYTSLFPCVACARAIIQVGGSTVVTHTPDIDDERWGREFELSTTMLKEAGVTLRLLEETQTVN